MVVVSRRVRRVWRGGMTSKVDGDGNGGALAGGGAGVEEEVMRKDGLAALKGVVGADI